MADTTKPHVSFTITSRGELERFGIPLGGACSPGLIALDNALPITISTDPEENVDAALAFIEASMPLSCAGCDEPTLHALGYIRWALSWFSVRYINDLYWFSGFDADPEHDERNGLWGVMQGLAILADLIDLNKAR